MFRLAFVFAPLLFGLLLGGFVVWAQRPDSPPSPNQGFRPIAPPQTRQMPSTQRIREATEFKDLHVEFRPGERTALYTVENNQRFICLENLALERILTIIEQRPDRQYWKIEGTFTEFRGENFILIRRFAVAVSPTAAVPVVL